MFDVAPTEFILVAVIALLVIGPKDLPKVMRVVGNWIGKARRVANHFRAGMDDMIRQSELEEMEKKWAAENERIMRESPVLPAPESASSDTPAAEASHSTEMPPADAAKPEPLP